MNLALYYHTLRHLRPVQFYGRLAHRLHRPTPDLRPAPPLRSVARPFPLPPLREPNLLRPSRFRALNVERDLDSPDVWNAPDADKLWLYNLHYFDDLNAAGRDGREAWHRELMQRWVRENLPGHDNGWESYPLSLRIVNWVRWHLAGHALPEAALQSLAVQTRYLAQRPERHLLGNHYWANGKALVFAGTALAGPEADGWRTSGFAILDEQLAEQVLPDGGHFERSPMYHALFLEDLLDLVALAESVPGVLDAGRVERWRTPAARMFRWLQAMTHPDGDIGFFNDAALGVALPPAAIGQLMSALAIEHSPRPSTPLCILQPSGYVRADAGEFTVIADVGPVGPDYIPGHAHADTLSFELSWRGQRVFTNSGTSTYAVGAQRSQERATAAHNTVEIDGADSSEVWHGFRVARRARPQRCESSSDGLGATWRCAHDGYARLPGRPQHQRKWSLDARGLHIQDEVVGGGEHRITGRLHVQPGIEVIAHGDGSFRLGIPDVGVLEVGLEGCDETRLEQGQYAPQFGLRVSRPVIAWTCRGALPRSITTVIRPVS